MRISDWSSDVCSSDLAQTHGITVAIPPPAKAIGLPKVAGPGDDNRPLVVIDAGHGGHDPGALNKELGTREKDITLAITKAIRRELLKSGRRRVALTRDDDLFLVLDEPFGLDRVLNAALFISVLAHPSADEDA